MYLRDDLLKPIPGANPAGEELRYEPVYDEIKLARTEEDELPQGDWERERKTADYGKVIQLAQKALAERSKDLQLAVWLSEALLRKHGFQGFQEGLTLIGGLIDNFWDHVYPEIEEGDDVEFRAMPLEWLGGYLDLAVRCVPVNERGHTLLDYTDVRAMGYEGEEPDDEAKKKRQAAVDEGRLVIEDFDKAVDASSKQWYKDVVAAVDGCLKSIDELEKKCDEKFGSVAPSYSGLRKSIDEYRRLVAKILAEKLELDPDPIEVDTTLQGSAVDVAGAEAGTTVSAIPTSATEAAARIADAARFLRHEDPRNPAPYALLRGFRWAEVRRGGDPPDPRLLEAPPTELRTRLKTLLLDENWSALVDAAEDVMATPYGRGWLDLQRYVMTALRGLGNEYEAASRIVRESLARLLQDLPSLPDQALMDDSPTANRQTRGWLETEGILESSDGGAPASGPGAGAGSQRSRLASRARTLVQKGDAAKAVEVLLRAAEDARHPRDAFLHRMEAAEIMIEHGMEALATPILSDMVQQIDAHSLDEWEAGELVARPLVLAFRMKKAAGKKADDLYERIIRLDPVQAVQFQAEDQAREEAKAKAKAKAKPTADDMDDSEDEAS